LTTQYDPTCNKVNTLTIVHRCAATTVLEPRYHRDSHSLRMCDRIRDFHGSNLASEGLKGLDRKRNSSCPARTTLRLLTLQQELVIDSFTRAHPFKWKFPVWSSVKDCQFIYGAEPHALQLDMTLLERHVLQIHLSLYMRDVFQHVPRRVCLPTTS
jgi:hypothetical protein